MLILYQNIIIIPKNFKLLDFYIVNNIKYFSYFDNCLRVLNDTHLLAYLLATIVLPYWNQKRWLLQNIFGIYRMNLIFCYLLASWERLVYDNKMLENVLFIRNFKIFDRKYYFTYARYHNIDYLLYFYYKDVII